MWHGIFIVWNRLMHTVLKGAADKMNSKRYVHFWRPAGVESKYLVIVLDPQNSPFLPLTDFYNDQIGRVGNKTALSYLTSLENYFSWLDVTRNTKAGTWDGTSILKWWERPFKITCQKPEYGGAAAVRVKSILQVDDSPQTIHPSKYITSYGRRLRYFWRSSERVRKDKPRLPACSLKRVPEHQKWLN